MLPNLVGRAADASLGWLWPSWRSKANRGQIQWITCVLPIWYLVIKSRVLYIWSNNLHLLCTFQRRLPSFSTLDEWLALISSDAAFRSNSWVARLFPNRWFWSRWNQKLIKNVSELILSIISIHGLAPPLSDFNRLLYPSFISILLRA